MMKQFGALLLILIGLLKAQFLEVPPSSPKEFVGNSGELLFAQTPPPLLITEVYYDTPGEESEEEWIEIANVGTAVFPLNDIKIGDEESSGGGEGMKRFPEEAMIEPGQVIVVAQTAVGFRRLFNFSPDYEISDSDPNVPDMRRFLLWADGDIALANDGDELLLLDERNFILDSLSYGDSTHFFNPSIADVFAGVSIERIPAACDTDSAADWQPQDTPTPGQITLQGDCATPVNPATLETLPTIGELQGTGDASPYVNQIVSFRGVVTGSYEDQNVAGTTFYTLFVQDVVGFEDGNPATSDGLAIFLGRQRPSYQLGDQLRITGQMTEFFGYSEISDDNLEIIVEAQSAPLPSPIPIAPPADNQEQAAYFEAYESMRVTIPGAAQVVGATFSGCSFAVVNEGLGRVVRRSFTHPVGQIVPILHTSDVDCGDFPHVKSGDTVTGLTGPLIYNFDQFKIVQQETLALNVTASPFPPLPQPPVTTADQFTIATFNVENYFDTIDDTGDEAEPKPTADQLATKQAKLAQTVSTILGCPTLIGIQEVENAALLHDLAELIAPACGFTYAVAHLESADVRGIDVALLADPRRVTITGTQLRQGCTTINTGISDSNATCPAGQQPLFSRPPLQVDVTVDGRFHTLLINHFKSKREGEAETAPRRLAQAQHILSLVGELQTADPQANIIILGDFNDYELSTPMQTLTDGGLFNTLSLIPEAERYSFVFSGAAQLIDGIFISPSLQDNIASVHIFHVNADYPDSLAADTTVPYQATDHDLPLLVLTLDEIVEPTAVPLPTLANTPSPAPSPERNSPPAWLWAALLGGGAAGLAALFYLRRR
ncbi:MAG: lamin tail domain-containing protein [Ardenticatenaceae bacterium]|nr:lamin tail domain-containing protein [Ardenticatenaceae bacterium]